MVHPGGAGSTDGNRKSSGVVRRAVGLSLQFPVSYGSVSWPKKDVAVGGRKKNTHDWCCYLRPTYECDAPKFAALIDKVVFHLDKSFGTNAHRVVERPPFELWEEGWGQSFVDVQIVFRPEYGMSSPLLLQHFVRLHPYDHEVPQLSAMDLEEDSSKKKRLAPSATTKQQRHSSPSTGLGGDSSFAAASCGELEDRLLASPKTGKDSSPRMSSVGALSSEVPTVVVSEWHDKFFFVDPSESLVDLLLLLPPCVPSPPSSGIENLLPHPPSTSTAAAASNNSEQALLSKPAHARRTKKKPTGTVKKEDGGDDDSTGTEALWPPVSPPVWLVLTNRIDPSVPDAQPTELSTPPKAHQAVLPKKGGSLRKAKVPPSHQQQHQQLGESRKEEKNTAMSKHNGSSATSGGSTVGESSLPIHSPPTSSYEALEKCLHRLQQEYSFLEAKAQGTMAAFEDEKERSENCLAQMDVLLEEAKEIGGDRKRARE